jgi:hypothetical protein
VAEVLEHLPGKPEALSSNPSRVRRKEHEEHLPNRGGSNKVLNTIQEVPGERRLE